MKSQAAVMVDIEIVVIGVGQLISDAPLLWQIKELPLATTFFAAVIVSV